MSAAVAWKPNPGPQEEFLRSSYREVLYGGAAGGGKSDALLMVPLIDHNSKFLRGIILRRTYPELRDLIRRSKELYPAFEGRWKESTREWTFPSGAMIEFGYCRKLDDVFRYQGRQFTYIGWDELTQWPNDKAYRYLMSRLRTTSTSDCPLLVRATSNPGGVGHHWVQQRFKIPNAGTGCRVWDKDIQAWRKFMPARIHDNPYLAGTTYEQDLNALPEKLRASLKEGRWDVLEGVMFTQFDYDRHVCDPFAIPASWQMWRSCDDGFNAPAGVLWFARDNDTGRTFVFAELYKSGLIAEDLARHCIERDKRIPVRVGEDIEEHGEILTGWIDSAAFADTGIGSKEGKGRAQIMNALGAKWKACPKPKNSRVAGCAMVHSFLSGNLPDGKPKLMFFRNCKNLIRTLPTLPIDDLNTEDVDTDAEDHLYDSLRYGLAWRKSVIVQRKLTGL